MVKEPILIITLIWSLYVIPPISLLFLILLISSCRPKFLSGVVFLLEQLLSQLLSVFILKLSLFDVSVRVLQESITNRMYIFREKLSHSTVEAGKSKVCRASWPIGDPQKSRCCILESKVSLEAQCLLPWESSVFSLKTFNWLDEAQPLCKVICFTQSTNLNVNHF